MRFDRENKVPVENPTEKQIRRQLGYKKGGDNTFAILSATDGSYVQMLGGGVACCLEWRDVQTGRHFRAFQATPRVPWKNTTRLGSILLQPREFFFIEQVADAFVAFLRGQPFPPEIKWRDITDELAERGFKPK
jgi:hypothetical protein